MKYIFWLTFLWGALVVIKENNHSKFALDAEYVTNSSQPNYYGSNNSNNFSPSAQNNNIYSNGGTHDIKSIKELESLEAQAHKPKKKKKTRAYTSANELNYFPNNTYSYPEINTWPLGGYKHLPSSAYNYKPVTNTSTTSNYWNTPSSSTGTGGIYSGNTYTTDDTYVQNGTEYYSNATYKTTGQPKVKRNMATRHKFLKEKGFDEVPEGYEVDHIIPLSQGGSDTPDNMQLLTKEEHRQKTARERAGTSHSSSTYTPASYFSTPTTTASGLNFSPSASPVIHTGPRGGQYYINDNGNKTYIKKGH
jgi:hypothetical protein